MKEPNPEQIRFITTNTNSNIEKFISFYTNDIYKVKILNDSKLYELQLSIKNSSMYPILGWKNEIDRDKYLLSLIKTSNEITIIGASVHAVASLKETVAKNVCTFNNHKWVTKNMAVQCEYCGELQDLTIMNKGL